VQELQNIQRMTQRRNFQKKVPSVRQGEPHRCQEGMQNRAHFAV
jgi:hypothetical protein